MVRLWNELPRDAVDALFLEVFSARLNQVEWGPEQPDLVGSNEPMAGLELGELSKLKSLLTRAVLRFCDSIYVILNREILFRGINLF